MDLVHIKPDGKKVWYAGRYTTLEMFKLKGMEYDPETARIMPFSTAFEILNEGKVNVHCDRTRTGTYAFYRLGIELCPRSRFEPFGNELVLWEKGIRIALEIPEVQVKLADGTRVDLREVSGHIGVFKRIETLDAKQIGNNSWVISVGKGFDPEMDIEVVDVELEGGSTSVASCGIPIRAPTGSSIIVAERRHALAVGRNVINMSKDHDSWWKEGTKAGWHCTVNARGDQAEMALQVMLDYPVLIEEI